jgi:nucleoside 2-deoxyribosyltransferase
MNCFIASAFNYPDVDNIFNRVVRPVLRGFNIKPLRVDRVEHNEDIDDKIFGLIDKSAVCIADLTYARPSVYYEAGYAFGTGKPVIYMARRDHFHSKVDDLSGNFRVHFDLQMKNIIAWDQPNESCKNRLQKRLRHVLAPVLAKKNKDKAIIEGRKRFSILSQNDMLEDVITDSRNMLFARGFKRGPRSKLGPLRSYRFYEHLTKLIGKQYIQIHLLALPKITNAYLNSVPWLWVEPLLTRAQEEVVSAVKSCCVIGAIRPSGKQKLATCIPSWSPVEESIYTKKFEATIRKVPNTGVILFIDGILSKNEYKDQFRDAIAKILSL